MATRQKNSMTHGTANTLKRKPRKVRKQIAITKTLAKCTTIKQCNNAEPRDRQGFQAWQSNATLTKTLNGVNKNGWQKRRLWIDCKAAQVRYWRGFWAISG
jgi:hypothetical protein